VLDAFRVLALPLAWRMHDQVIRDAQRRLAARWHPDRCVDPALRNEAHEQVARANAAAAELLDELVRGEVLLRCCAPSPKPPAPPANQSFLMQMMELREVIDAGDVSELDSVRATLGQLHESAAADAQIFFDRLLAGDANAWTQASEALGRLRAVRRAREGLPL